MTTLLDDNQTYELYSQLAVSILWFLKTSKEQESKAFMSLMRIMMNEMKKRGELTAWKKESPNQLSPLEPYLSLTSLHLNGYGVSAFDWLGMILWLEQVFMGSMNLPSLFLSSSSSCTSSLISSPCTLYFHHQSINFFQ